MRSLLALMLFAAPCRAAFDSGSVGTSAAVFLRMPVGARAAAMGEAQTAVVDDASAMDWNPAALTRVDRRSAVLQHAEHIADTSFDYAAFVQNFSSVGAVGFAVRHFSAGRIAETDNTGTETGSFTPRDISAAAGYACRLPYGIAAGVAAKFIRSKILASAQTAAFDIGLLTGVPGWERASLAVAVSNIGGSLTYETVAEKLPTTVRFGAGWRDGGWTAAADAVLARDNGPVGAFGLERQGALWRDWRGALRAGLNTRTLGDIAGFSGASFGAGLGHGPIAVDYAFMPFGGVGSSHLLSLRLMY